MFERFTGRARHVVVLAQEEARHFNHNYIGTEHVLLGLLGEPESVAGKVLARFGMTHEGVRAEFQEIVDKGKSQKGKAPTGHIPFTPRAKKTLELSLREALALKHKYIGTEHILLAMIRQDDGVAVHILRNHADLTELRFAVLDAIPTPELREGEEPEEANLVIKWLKQRLAAGWSNVPDQPAQAEAGDVTAGADATPAVQAALRQASALAGHSPVGSHHLLLAALADTNSAASAALASLGVDLDALREKLRAAKVVGTSDEKPEQAGRRQTTIQVTGDILTLTFIDPVIVEAGQAALRAVNANPEASGESATSTVIRGDHPAAGNLAQVWTELNKTLTDIAGATLKAAAKNTEAEAKAATDKVIIVEKDTPDAGEAGEATAS